MLKITEKEWKQTPKGRKGHVTRDVSFEYRPGRHPGTVRVIEHQNGSLEGRRTLVRGGRLLVEGVDFVFCESMPQDFGLTELV